MKRVNPADYINLLDLDYAPIAGDKVYTWSPTRDTVISGIIRERQFRTYDTVKPITHEPITETARNYLVHWQTGSESSTMEHLLYISAKAA